MMYKYDSTSNLIPISLNVEVNMTRLQTLSLNVHLWHRLDQEALLRQREAFQHYHYNITLSLFGIKHT